MFEAATIVLAKGTWVASHIQYHLPGIFTGGIFCKKSLKIEKGLKKPPGNMTTQKKNDIKICSNSLHGMPFFRLVEKELSATILKQRLQCKVAPTQIPFEVSKGYKTLSLPKS